MKQLMLSWTEHRHLHWKVMSVVCTVLLVGCSWSQDQDSFPEEVEVQTEGTDQNVEGLLFADFEAFYQSIYFSDGSQPESEFQDSFFFEINDAVEKTGIEEFRAKEFYEENKNDSEILRSMILRLNRARWVKDLFE